MLDHNKNNNKKHTLMSGEACSQGLCSVLKSQFDIVSITQIQFRLCI